MRGYSIAGGYMGFVPWMGRYLLFATDRDYQEYCEPNETAADVKPAAA